MRWGHERGGGLLLGIPMCATRGIENRFVQSLAAFAGDAGMAEAAGTREGAEFVVGFVDDDRLDARQRPHIAIERRGAGDRLLYEQRTLSPPLASPRSSQPWPPSDQPRQLAAILVTST